jgi:cation transport regulator ChaC
MKRWIKREVEEVKAERAAAQQERGSLKDLIHDVADVVIALRVATEDLEQALQELAQREEASERPDDGVDG